MTTRKADGPRAEGLRDRVRDRYAKIASGVTTGGACCGSVAGASSCGGGSSCSQLLGYAPEELASLPKGADLGLGCGNPTALASLRPGDVVLDLGSGAGIDCFLAAKKVGSRGRVIGVDMTADMLARARVNARSGHYRQVEFRLGEIEHLPVADQSVSVVISNCVINLVPDKGAVYREAFRVLRPMGRLAVSDVVATRRITKSERADPSLWSSCSSGAIPVGTLRTLLRKVGFTDVEVRLASLVETPETLKGQASLGVVPAFVRATKPLK